MYRNLHLQTKLSEMVPSIVNTIVVSFSSFVVLLNYGFVIVTHSATSDNSPSPRFTTTCIFGRSVKALHGGLMFFFHSGVTI